MKGMDEITYLMQEELTMVSTTMGSLGVDGLLIRPLTIPPDEVTCKADLDRGNCKGLRVERRC